MKKNELVKKSRKLLSAILTGTVLITSVVPESLIWAADVEMQEFEDGEDNEDVIFEAAEEAAEEPAEEPETEDKWRSRIFQNPRTKMILRMPWKWKKTLRMELLFLAAAVRWQWEQRLRIRFRRGKM